MDELALFRFRSPPRLVPFPIDGEKNTRLAKAFVLRAFVLRAFVLSWAFWLPPRSRFDL